jgi:hypothetical protein
MGVRRAAWRSHGVLNHVSKGFTGSMPGVIYIRNVVPAGSRGCGFRGGGKGI